MKTTIELAKLNEISSYFAKANKEDAKRTEYKVSLGIPEDTDQATFDAIVNHILTLGKKSVMYGPEKPDKYDFTKNLYNPAMEVKGERTEKLPVKIAEAFSAATTKLDMSRATGAAQKDAKARGLEFPVYLEKMFIALVKATLADAKNKAGELLVTKHEAAIASHGKDYASREVAAVDISTIEL